MQSRTPVEYALPIVLSLSGLTMEEAFIDVAIVKRGSATAGPPVGR